MHSTRDWGHLKREKARVGVDPSRQGKTEASQIWGTLIVCVRQKKRLKKRLMGNLSFFKKKLGIIIKATKGLLGKKAG